MKSLSVSIGEFLEIVFRRGVVRLAAQPETGIGPGKPNSMLAKTSPPTAIPSRSSSRYFTLFPLFFSWFLYGFVRSIQYVFLQNTDQQLLPSDASMLPTAVSPARILLMVSFIFAFRLRIGHDSSSGLKIDGSVTDDHGSVSLWLW